MIEYAPLTHCHYWNNSITFHTGIHFTLNQHIEPYDSLLFWSTLSIFPIYIHIHHFQYHIMFHVYPHPAIRCSVTLYLSSFSVPHPTLTLSSTFRWHHKEVPNRYLLPEVRFLQIQLYHQI